MHYLVDGYSVIHARPDLRKALSKRLAHARNLLLDQLQRYQDHAGEAVTVFFDGCSGPDSNPPKAKKKRMVISCTPPGTVIGIIFSKQGQSADTLIEQCVGQSHTPSEYLVVTADHAIENTISALGASSSSPDNFFEIINRAEEEFSEWLIDHRMRTKRKFS